MPLNKGYHVLKIIEDFGQDLLLVKKCNVEYNPATSTITADPDCIIPFVGYLYDSQDSVIVDQSLVKVVNKRCLIPALGLKEPPEVDDFIRQGDNEFKITAVRISFNSGIPLQYSCELVD